MPRISLEVITHRLNVDLTFRLVKQKKRSFTSNWTQAIDEEVTKLLQAGFIHEVHYPKWLANVVLIKKANDKWQICIDYIDLNKAYPKDNYPLPSIDQLVDATSRFHLMSFIDAFSSYNQIWMVEEDEEKMAFITDREIYCYKIMSFGLKNVGAIY